MANLMRKSLSVLGSQSFKSSARLLIGSGIKDLQFPSRAVTLSRSIWCLASNNSSSRNFKPTPALKTCSRCQLHTEDMVSSQRKSTASSTGEETEQREFYIRLYIIFGFCRDCPRTLASCRDYCPRKLASCRDCPRDSASCREPRQEAESRGQSAGSNLSCTEVSAGSKISRTVSAKAKYDVQSLQEAKVSGIDYTLWLTVVRKCGADQELVNFLKEEIASEKKLDHKKVSKIEGWDIQTSGSEVTLQKKSGDETLSIKMNVNNSVHTNDEVEEDQAPTMVSKPPFEVNIKKSSGKTITFQCDFYDADDQEFEEAGEGKEQQDAGVGDLFNINEVSLHTDEMKDSDYFMSAENMDATMYDLFMDMLDERGVSSDFITQLMEFSTTYEHDQYVNFLEKLNAVVNEK